MGLNPYQFHVGEVNRKNSGQSYGSSKTARGGTAARPSIRRSTASEPEKTLIAREPSLTTIKAGPLAWRLSQAHWCGDRLSLPVVDSDTLSSRKLKTPLSEHNRTSGTPGIAQLSSLVVSILRPLLFRPSLIRRHNPLSRFVIASFGIWFFDFFGRDVDNWFKAFSNSLKFLLHIFPAHLVN